MDIVFGLNLISYCYRPERAPWIAQSLETLGNTDLTGLNPVFFQLTYKPTDFEYGPSIMNINKKWNNGDGVKAYFYIDEEPPEVKGLDPVFIWSANRLLAYNTHPEITHIVFLTDDVLYNPQWLQQTSRLIERHPKARAWTTYRSAYDRHHKTLKTATYQFAPILEGGASGPIIEECTDHYVSSISGIGTMSRKEWETYAPDWKRGHGGFPVPATYDIGGFGIHSGGGNTLDLHHAFYHQGERWATEKSYQEHIGVIGTHATGVPEHGVDFVGID